jgi:hypothetical protein
MIDDSSDEEEVEDADQASATTLRRTTRATAANPYVVKTPFVVRVVCSLATCVHTHTPNAIKRSTHCD